MTYRIPVAAPPLAPPPAIRYLDPISSVILTGGQASYVFAIPLGSRIVRVQGFIPYALSTAAMRTSLALVAKLVFGTFQSTTPYYEFGLPPFRSVLLASPVPNSTSVAFAFSLIARCDVSVADMSSVILILFLTDDFALASVKSVQLGVI